MARQFTQKHYIAVADALVEAYQHPAIGSALETRGIDKARASFVKLFNADSGAFDCGKFHKYIEARLAGRLADGTGAPAATECGREWHSLAQSCYRCNNDGAHYHYSDGSCDMEPCVRHGGPQ